MKLDLGCGIGKKRAGFIGMDQFKGDGVDIVCNIDKQGIKLKDNSVSHLYTSHVLEHVEDLVKTMEEIYRVCKPGATVEIKVPHFSGGGGFYCFHKRFFRTHDMDDFDKVTREMFVTDKADFVIEESRLIFIKRWYMPWNYLTEAIFNFNYFTMKIYEATFFRNLFPAFEVQLKLRVRK